MQSSLLPELPPKRTYSKQPKPPPPLPSVKPLQTQKSKEVHIQKAEVGHNITRKLVKPPPLLPKENTITKEPEPKSHHTSGKPETTPDDSCNYEEVSQSSYVKFSKAPQPLPSTYPNSKLGEQLGTIQATLLTVVKQMSEMQTRQSALERELQAMKGSESAEESSTVTANMSPADVSASINVGIMVLTFPANMDMHAGGQLQYINRNQLFAIPFT